MRLVGVSLVGLVVGGLAVLWMIALLRLSYRKRQNLTSYAVYLLINDGIRADHKAKFEGWIRDSGASTADELSLRAGATVEAMADALAGGGSLLGAHAMLWNSEAATALRDTYRMRTAGPEQTAEETGSAVSQDAEALVHAYGEVLEAASTGEGMSFVFDSALLPAPKGEIKAALLAALRVTGDRQLQEFLKVGFIELAMFQPGVGSTPIGFPSIDPDDPEAFEAALPRMVEASPQISRWLEISNLERHQLTDELRQAGF